MEEINSDVSPSQDAFELADYNLEFAFWRLEQLRLAAIQQRLCRPRSLAWAIMLKALPQPSDDLMTSIKTHRNFYNDLRKKLFMDPRNAIGDDPLSQNDESAWNQHFCDNELRALILQDVVRTYPDEDFFRDKDVEDIMVRVLFFWARSHSNVGYRQGMHEILAPLLLELHIDRLYASNDLCDNLKYFLDETYLEHDSYMLFNAIMKGLERFYTTGDIVPTSCGRLPTTKELHSPNEIVRYLDRVREDYLLPLDSELAMHLSNCNISMELFGIRWLRLLFGREFPRSEIPHLWGFLFSDGPMLPNIQFIVVAMLISMRTLLLNEDSGTVLSALMRPCPVSAGHVCALALHLRRPLQYPAPPQPPPTLTTNHQPNYHSSSDGWEVESEVLHTTSGVGGSGTGEMSGGVSEGVAEGADVARELATLAIVRAHLPRAAHALAHALPKPPNHVAQPLHQILQLASLLQCRNHALIDVETALEAAEGQTADNVGRKQLVPVTLITGKRTPIKQTNKQTNKVNQVKEVPLKLFHQVETICASDLPSLDPLRLRTE